MNSGYADCGTYVVGALLLEEIWQKYQENGVDFLRVSIYDHLPTAVAYTEENGITYPSVIDVTYGRVKATSAGVIPIQTTPTIQELDREERASSRIIRKMESTSNLDALVSGACEEAE